MQVVCVLSVCLLLLEVVQQVSPLRCGVGRFRCKDESDCLVFNHVCDGERDCADGSDEENCLSDCTAGQFQCAHGKLCIEKTQVCDGTPQCQDRSDESECVDMKEDCEHQCDKKCLPKSFICDGQRDCQDGSDEDNCGDVSCSSSEFGCRSGQCVTQTVRCDGHPDCTDQSDEEGCVHWTHCYSHQNRCQSYGKCEETSDRQCSGSPVHCGQYQWRCVSQDECVPQSWVCDGTEDCVDKSDEADCNPICRPHQFQCSSSECIDPALLCNNKSDCLDGSDEGGACLTDTCAGKSRCAQDCYSTPRGPRCWCGRGFRPVHDDGVECVDVDECVQTPAVCGHTCINTEGSYRCSCIHGYTLEPDGHTCNTTGESLLLVSGESDLLLMNLQDSSVTVLLSDMRPVLSLDVDRLNRRVYWVDQDQQEVKWISLDQKNGGAVLRDVQVGSVQVDWLGRSLYWTDRLRGHINAAGLEGTEAVPIIEEDLQDLTSLCLLPQRGLMFWTEVGDEGQIERAGMDGSDRRVLVSGSLMKPVGLSVDQVQQRLYWTDQELHCISSATLEGGDVQVVQLMESPRPFSISVIGQMIYWSDVVRGTVQRAHKVTHKHTQVLLRRPGHMINLQVVEPRLQESVQNPCVLQRCSHLCVLTPALTGVCKCPAGLLLDRDGYTCVKNNCTDQSDKICTGVQYKHNNSTLNISPVSPSPADVNIAVNVDVSPSPPAGEDSDITVKGVDAGEDWDALQLVQNPAVYSVGGVCVAVIVVGVAIGIVRRRKAASRRQVVERETRMRDLEMTGASTTSQTDRTTAPEHTQDEASAVD